MTDSQLMATHNIDIKERVHLESESPRRSSVATSSFDDLDGERKVRRALEDAAQQNTALLNEINTTEEAVSVLQSNEIRLEHAKHELKHQDKTVDKAKGASKRGLHGFKHNHESRTTRWLYILTRMRSNYEAKAKYAEQSYHQALTAQSEAEKRQRELQQDIRAIEQENAKLEKLAEKHVEAHKAIDSLYAKLFTGPTPGFPDEDEQEALFIAAEAEHRATSRTLQVMTKAYKHIQSVQASIERAHAEIAQAEEEIDSAFFVAEYTHIFVERAARFVERAVELLGIAIEAMPKPLDRELVRTQDRLSEHLSASWPLITKVFLAVHPSRTVYYSLLQAVAKELQYASDAQTDVAKLVKRYQSIAKDSVTLSSRTLEDARQVLQEIRQSAFEVTVGFGAAAPAYHECCDRAEWYANTAYAACENMAAPTVDLDSLPPLPSYEQVVG